MNQVLRSAKQPWNPKYILAPGTVIEQIDDTTQYMVITRKTSFKVKKYYAKVLLSFNQETELDEKYSKADLDLIAFFLDKHVIVPVRAGSGFTFGRFWSMIYRIVRIRIPINLENIVVRPKHISILTGLSVTFIVMGLTSVYLNRQLLIFEELNRNDLLIIYFSVVLTAILHEIFETLYTLSVGSRVREAAIRITWFMFLSFTTNKVYLYEKDKSDRIYVFSRVIISMLGFVGIVFSLAALEFRMGNDMMGVFLKKYAYAALIMIGISIYPFLFRSDGYSLFQEITGVYGVRKRFFSKIFKKNHQRKESVKQKLVSTVWGVLFILSVLAVVFAAFKGIRIIP
ncbi:hypothetical protein J8137_02635 [Lactiplantibacillus plantarum]|nr:hypothetical protein [Lactiplantibacillus plantarum]